MHYRVLILPIAAAAIFGLCAYRIATLDPDAPRPIPPTSSERPAPRFQLYNQKSPSELVKLDAFIGRHPILIAFFDATKGANDDPTLDRLRRDFEKLDDADVKIFAVSTALPQDNRKAIEAGGPFPFHLLSDPSREAHKAWGVDPERRPVGAVFFIDRAGNVDSGANGPRPLQNPDEFISRLLQP